MLCVTDVAVDKIVSTQPNIIERALTNFGFPIVVCGFLFWYIYKTHNEYRQDYKELHEQHNKEVMALTTALTSNTETIKALKDMLDDCSFIDKSMLKEEYRG